MTSQERYLFVWLLGAGPSLALGDRELLVSMKVTGRGRKKTEFKQTGARGGRNERMEEEMEGGREGGWEGEGSKNERRGKYSNNKTNFYPILGNIKCNIIELNVCMLIHEVLMLSQ